MSKRNCAIHYIFILLTLCLPAQGVAALPNGLSVIALSQDEWRVFVVSEGQLKTLDEIESPRSGSYHHTQQLYAFIGVDGLLKERDLTTQSTTPVAGLNKSSRFTQPHYSADGNWLYAVELPEGKSRRTNIIGFKRDTGEQHGIVRKRTAQFEPFVDSNHILYYTTAICVDDCEGMIWELWRRDLQSGRQEQLTLMNAVANQPHSGGDGWLYFSSNADNGRFHIWRMLPEVGATPQQLTSGNVRDSDPALSSDGGLYFLRKSIDGASLMRWDNNIVTKMETPDLLDLRNLEIGR